VSLARQDAYYWRFAGTAFSFTLFGLFGLLLGIVVLPGLALLPGGGGARCRRARTIVRRCFRAFIEITRSLGFQSYRFEGAARLGQPGQLVVANHPSLIDVVFLIAFTPQANCVVKAAMWRNPFTRWVATAARYIPNAPTDRMIELAAAALAAGETLIVFPEGTRTRPGEPRVFHRGAASIAVRAAARLTPVLIQVSPTTLTKAEPWYRIPPQRPHFALRVGEDVAVADLAGIPPPRASRELNSRLLAYYAAQLPSTD
jgi:1-acyl-sn-glycerol-3-phosphate acyltransferase